MEEIKDLGGLVNKDLAFSKLPQGAVFDSQNFRITSNDGNTTAARENIRGTEQIASTIPNPCISNITFDAALVNALFIPGQNYTIDTDLDSISLATFNFTYVDLTTLVTDYAAHLAAQPDVITRNITVTATSSNIITFILPDCNTITVTNITNPGRPNVLQDYPYQLFDPEFSVENYQGTSYNASAPGNSASAVQWSWNNTSPATAPNLITSQMSTGVVDSTGNPVPGTSGLTVLQYGGDSIVAPFITETYFRGSAAYINQISPTSPSLFEYFTEGPYQVDLDFYVAKTTKCDMTIRLLLDLGAGLNLPLPIGYNSVTIPSYANHPLLQLGSDIYIPANTTDANFLAGAGGSPAGFTFQLPPGIKFKDLVNNTAPYNWSFVIQVITTNPGFIPPAYDFKIFFNQFSFKGPPLNLTSVVSTNLIATSINAGLIIGWVALRDDIYLFTTDGIFDPDDPNTWGGPTPPTTTGQIWKLSYNKAGNYADPTNYSLTLIYSNNLNFTTARPIANPGMIEARYENSNIQKIYWTDNYNVPRQINVADPNVANLPVADLNLQPSLSMDLPLVTEVIDQGGLLVGVYQIAYRLKNVNGAETRFSRTSQLIPIIDAQESGATVGSYFPRATVQTAANKSIRVRVNNLDTSYDIIEYALIYYYDDTSPPKIYIAGEEFINGPSANTLISGNGTLIPITSDEFTAFNSSIIRCKTLAAKKQTLFLGNITISDQVIDFDARTYRFPINSNTTLVRDDLTSPQDTVTYNPANNSFTIGGNAVPKTHGAFQTYADQSPTVATNYLYQPNSNVLGGAGPNVKYEFFTENVSLSPYNNTPRDATNPLVTPNTAAVINFNSIDRNYVSDGVSLSSYASPYVYDMYVGYRRDEMYRFGIVFFDELDNPTYVNWIGDIRMPHPFMPSASAGASGLGPRSLIGNTLNSTFSSSHTYDWDNPGNIRWKDLFARPLGVKFTIDFSSIAPKYKKAAIVRAPLEQQDKHILGQGIFLPTYKTVGLGSSPNYVFLCSPYNYNAAQPVPGNANTPINDIWPDCWTLRSPEFLFKDFPGFVGGDTVDVFGIMGLGFFDFFLGQDGPTVNAFSRAAEADYFNTAGTDVRYSAFFTLAYDLLESATYPNTIKNTALTENPYPLALAAQITSGGNDRLYTKLSTTINNGGNSAVRTVLGCSPKDPLSNSGGGGVQTPTNLGTGTTTSGFSYTNRCLFVQFQNSVTENFNQSIFPGGNEFYNLDPWNNTGNKYIANYKRNVVDPYGGQDYFSRANTEYIPCNNLIDITSTPSSPGSVKQTKVFGGDTIISVFDHVSRFIDRAEASLFGNNRVDVYTEYIYMPVETSVAVEYRRSANNQPYSTTNYTSAVPNRNYVFCAWGNVGDAAWYTPPQKLESSEYFNVDPVFNYTKKSLYTYFPEPALGGIPTTYDCRVWRSEKKIDGEITESWSVFKPSAYLDVESAYGPLNNLVVFQDKLYFIQDRGFGVLQVAEQKLISDAAGTADLVLGSSGILERYDYISTKTGTKHQFSMSVSDYSMIWFDTLARKMYRFKPGALEPVSDIKGYNTFLYNNTGGAIQTKDNPYYMDPFATFPYSWIGTGIHSTYDFRHNEFYMTFLNPADNLSTTLVYNDIFDGFVGKYTITPKVFINDKVNIFAPWLDVLNFSTTETIHILNYGDYGRFFNNRFTEPSYLSFVVNANPTLEKTFTNLEVVAEAYKLNTYNPGVNQFFTPYDALAEIDYQDFFEQMRVFDNYQNTDWQFLNTLSRRHKTIWNIKVPSDRVLDVNSNIFDTLNIDPARPRLTRRLKDKWFVVELRYNNNPNNKFVVHTAKAIYSANSR